MQPSTRKKSISRETGSSDKNSRLRKACVRKFLYYFPDGYKDATYIEWERNYKWQAHLEWEKQLNKRSFAALLKTGDYQQIAQIAVRIESRTNLLFSFEKMALRDAVKSGDGASRFAHGLFDYIYGEDPLEERFKRFTEIVAALPRKQTRVLTWPLTTVFGFIARPDEHIFLKPKVTRAAAEKFGFSFHYTSRPNWDTYKNLLQFASEVKTVTRHLHPADYIDLQSFIWVMGSDEYPD